MLGHKQILVKGIKRFDETFIAFKFFLFIFKDNMDASQEGTTIYVYKPHRFGLI